MARRENFTREALRGVRFAIVGVINTANNLVSFAILLALGVPYLAASIIASAIAISIAYFLNHRYTFRVAEHSAGLVVRFFAVQIFGAVLNLAALALLVETWGWDPFLAQLAVMVPVVLTTFALNRLVVFHGHVDTRVG